MGRVYAGCLEPWRPHCSFPCCLPTSPGWVLGYPAPLALGPLAPSRQSRPPSFPQGVWTWGTYPLQHPGQRVDDSTTHSAGNKAEPSPAHPIQVPGASWHQRKLHHPWGYSVLCGLGQWAFGMGRGLAQLSGPRLGTVYGSVR